MHVMNTVILEEDMDEIRQVKAHCERIINEDPPEYSQQHKDTCGIVYETLRWVFDGHAAPILYEKRLPTAYNGCNCPCHRVPGLTHINICCHE